MEADLTEETGRPAVSKDPNHSLYDANDPLIRRLHWIIRAAVRVLAVLMVFVIVWGIGDVVYGLYRQLVAPPFMLLSMNEVLSTFGGFLAVLIAIEIFTNITLYLKSEVIPVQLVIATALMAIARKVIIFDFSSMAPGFVFGTAAVILALGVTYWLLTRRC